MYALIAAVPILFTVVTMVGFNWPAKRALPSAWLIACLVSGFFWKIDRKSTRLNSSHQD